MVNRSKIRNNILSASATELSLSLRVVCACGRWKKLRIANLKFRNRRRRVISFASCCRCSERKHSQQNTGRKVSFLAHLHQLSRHFLHLIRSLYSPAVPLIHHNFPAPRLQPKAESERRAKINETFRLRHLLLMCVCIFSSSQLSFANESYYLASPCTAAASVAA